MLLFPRIHKYLFAIKALLDGKLFDKLFRNVTKKRNRELYIIII